MENISVNIRLKPFDLSSNEEISSTFHIEGNKSIINLKTKEKLTFGKSSSSNLFLN
jgi:hypothetical protein